MFIQEDASLDWVYDTAGLKVYDGPRQGSRTGSPHIEGTYSADAVKGSLTEGDGWLNGLVGNDVIYGAARNENLVNGDGDAVLVAGAGYDIIWAGDGDDILDGGEGNDELFGEAGNDTYIFRIGSGQDIIREADATTGNSDTVWLGSYLTPDDVKLTRAGFDLVLSIEGSSDTLTVDGFFRDTTFNRIERIRFMDKTVWTYEDILYQAFRPTEGDDVIYGTSDDNELNGAGGDDRIFARPGNDLVLGETGADTLYGEEGDDTLEGGTGDDTLYGQEGNDILAGGEGDDLLEGGVGDDTYLFGLGDGHDTIGDKNAERGGSDTIEFGENILPTSI
jgi:Ca2+-binding RTX toxin-like protein